MMMMRGHSCVLGWMLLLPTVVVADTTVDSILAWVQSKGGFWNEKVEIRRVWPTPEFSYMGVFARQDLQANEKIMNIPVECYIQVWQDAKPMSDDAIQDEAASFRNYYENVCMLSELMKNEMDLGEQSKYAPYVAYLQQQGTGQLPAVWSAKGKELLRKFIPPNSDVVDWMELHYKDNSEGIAFDCLQTESTPAEEHLLAMTVQRCYDTSLIPLWDMVNHDNANINTNNTSMYDDDGITVWASQPIAAGDEILASYDVCLDCMDISDYWGTPEILRDFGFVERNLQRWVFVEPEVWFEVHTKDGSKVVYWDDADPSQCEPYPCWGAPGPKGIAFLKEEIDRLQSVVMDDNDTTVPVSELSTIRQYRDAAITAMTLAVEAAEKKLLQNTTCAPSESCEAAQQQ